MFDAHVSVYTRKKTNKEEKERKGRHKEMCKRKYALIQNQTPTTDFLNVLRTTRPGHPTCPQNTR